MTDHLQKARALLERTAGHTPTDLRCHACDGTGSLEGDVALLEACILCGATGWVKDSLPELRESLAWALGEIERLRAQFTRLDKPKHSGDPMLDAVLQKPNAEFRAWVESLPPTYWARYDLSAARIGWEAARASGPVHNHGVEDGPGLACKETRLPNGRLIGDCLRGVPSRPKGGTGGA